MTKTYSALQNQIKQLQVKAEAVKKKEAAGIISRIKETIGIYGITAEDLFSNSKPQAAKKAVKKPVKKNIKVAKSVAKKKVAAKKTVAKTNPLAGTKRPPKYKDKNGNAWAGGGSMPRWLKDYADKGGNIEDFRVKPA